MEIKRSGNHFAAFAVMPVFFSAMLRAEGEHAALERIVLLCVAALFVFLLPRYGAFAPKTPLVLLDDTALTFFGPTLADRRSFRRNAISHIRLSARPEFWRSAFRLSLVVDGETVNLWISHTSAGSVRALARALRAEFPAQFEYAAP